MLLVKCQFDWEPFQALYGEATTSILKASGVRRPQPNQHSEALASFPQHPVLPEAKLSVRLPFAGSAL